MPYPLASQLNKDIDFFIMDAKQNKLHFASAGGMLPEMIALKYEANRRIHRSVIQLEELFEVEINPNLFNILNFQNDEMREIYLRDFIFYAKRGFYSFDRTYLADSNDTRYHLVASPIANRIRPTSINNELMEDLKIEESLKIESFFNILNIV